MNVKVGEQKRNPLLKREEMHCIFEHPGRATPSRKEMLPDLEKILKTKKDLIIIDKIFSVKGKGKSKAHVLVYKKKEDVPKEKLEKMQRRMEKNAKVKKPSEEEKPAGPEKAEEIEKEVPKEESEEKKGGAEEGKAKEKEQKVGKAEEKHEGAKGEKAEEEAKEEGERK